MRTVLSTLSLGAFGVLTAAVIICVGLTGGALVKANDSLGVVDTALTSVAGHADPLTYQVHLVNTSLTSIEQDLSPLHGQADTLNGSLATVNQTLTSADASVSSILGKANAIEPSLVDVDHQLATEAQEVGTTRASARVGLLNDQVSSLAGILGPVQGDLGNIEGLLRTTNDHLTSSCLHLAGLTSLLPLLGHASSPGTCS